MSKAQETAAQLDSAIDHLIEDERAPVAPDEGELLTTARLLRRSLPRVHPSFTFEEVLAARLAAARRTELAPSGAAAAGGAPTPIRPRLEVAAPGLTPEAGGPGHRRRNLVAGGAIASGVSLALPIAGAAIVVWRRSRSSGGLF